MMTLALKIVCCLTIAFILGVLVGFLLGRIKKCESIKNRHTKENAQSSLDENEDSIEKEAEPSSEIPEGEKPKETTTKASQERIKSERELREEALNKKHRNDFVATLVQEEFIEKERAKKEVGTKPTFLNAPQGSKDELKKISGIGPKIERVLNDLGIFHFHQIAKFSEENITWLDNYLSFRGRIKRDNWVEQAKILANGGETEFSKRFHS